MLDHRFSSLSVAARRRSAIAAIATLALAIGCWVVALRQTRGMNMGVATDLGSFGVFIAAWLPMMAAMMLPGAVPTVMKRARSMSVARSVPLFVVMYVAVWGLVGIAVYVLYRPHGPATAGILVIATGIYELTPLKTRCRRRCREAVAAGEFSLACIGSSIGLMVALIALGSMSVKWMVIIALVVLLQKILPAQRAVDVPFAFAIVALGLLALAAPASIPGLMPSM